LKQNTTLLVCAATLGELQAFWAEGESYPLTEEALLAQSGGVTFLLTGVGIPYALGRLLPVAMRQRPAQILNIGIAGAYPGRGLQIGDVVLGVSEVYGDVGFELPNTPHFQPIRDAPFGGFYQPPLPLSTDWDGPTLRQGRGCTVNACTGTAATGKRRAQVFEADFETMEGAAVAQIGQMLGIPVVEIRAISNLAARRDMRLENIALALSRLKHYFRACREIKNE